MADPADVLGLTSDATEEEIRQRYLALVRQHPPDRDPERFAEIRAAYDQLRDPITNLQQRLFSTTPHETFESLADQLRAEVRVLRIPTEVLLSLPNE